MLTKAALLFALTLAGCPDKTVTPSPVPAEAEPPQTVEELACVLPGTAVRWAMAYCMAVAGTDDLETVMGGECFAQAQAAKAGLEDCAQRLHWKTRLCELRGGDTPDSVATCVADAAFLPTGVADGF